MDHLTNRRPSFLSIVEKQRLAYHRLNESKTSRSEPELAHFRRSLKAVPLMDLEVAKLPLVQVIGGDQQYVVLGEVAQMPGRMMLLSVNTGTINIEHTAAQLELVPPG